jgi:hypothetical protein
LAPKQIIHKSAEWYICAKYKQREEVDETSVEKSGDLIFAAMKILKIAKRHC